MSLLKWTLFALLMLPFAEIAVFVVVGLKIGFLAALALTILTSLAGVAVIRRAGKGEVARLRTALGERVVNRVELDGPGLLTVLAGVLLVLPGFLTDIAGLLLLLPVMRRAVQAAFRRTAGRAAGRPDVVDLAPDQWRRVPDERIAKPSAGQD